MNSQVLEDNPGAETLSFSFPISFLNTVVFGTLGVGLQHAVRAAPEQTNSKTDSESEPHQILPALYLGLGTVASLALSKHKN